MSSLTVEINGYPNGNNNITTKVKNNMFNTTHVNTEYDVTNSIFINGIGNGTGNVTDSGFSRLTDHVMVINFTNCFSSSLNTTDHIGLTPESSESLSSELYNVLQCIYNVKVNTERYVNVMYICRDISIDIYM